MRTSTAEPLVPGLRFSTLMTRSAVYSSVYFSVPLVISEEPPMVPSMSKPLAPPCIGTACSLTVEPPSSKLLW